jgi:16S rRNA processing protein RimM
MDYIEVAKFTKVQGLRGGIRAQIYCDNTDVFAELAEKPVYLGEDKTPLRVYISEIRKGFVVLTVEDIDNAVAAENLVGELLYVLREEFPLPADTWFIRDLIGLRVLDADSGQLYGVVKEILQNAPKDVYVLRSPTDKTLMFPAIPEVLIDVDISGGVIRIRPLAGLFE